MHDFGEDSAERDGNEAERAVLDADDGGALGGGLERESDGSPTQRLSPRERQIMTLIIDGRTRKEVAFDLGIADSTVRVLYSRAMQKLSNRHRPVRRTEAR